jgi:hypothetical protein
VDPADDPAPPDVDPAAEPEEPEVDPDADPEEPDVGPDAEPDPPAVDPADDPEDAEVDPAEDPDWSEEDGAAGLLLEQRGESPPVAANPGMCAAPDAAPRPCRADGRSPAAVVRPAPVRPSAWWVSHQAARSATVCLLELVADPAAAPADPAWVDEDAAALVVGLVTAAADTVDPTAAPPGVAGRDTARCSRAVDLEAPAGALGAREPRFSGVSAAAAR